MLYTTVKNVPRYSPAMSTLSNGIDVLKALSENHWDATTIPLVPGIVAILNPNCDGTKKTGAINYYDITIGMRTTRCKYLRQAMTFLNNAIADKSQIADNNPERQKSLRHNILNALRENNWTPVNVSLPCGIPATITPIHSEKDGKQTIKGYELKSAVHTVYANSLNSLTAKMLACQTNTPIKEANPF